MNTPQSRLKHFVIQVFKRQKRFADEMGMSPSDVNKYIKENGHVFEKAEKYEKLTNLGLNVNWYLTGEGEMLIKEGSNFDVVSNQKFADVPTGTFEDLDEYVKNIKKAIPVKEQELNKMKKFVEAYEMSES